MTDAEIADALMTLARERGIDRTFCPSEVARQLSDDWRPLMTEVRLVAGTLPLTATQRGIEVDAVTARGPIRLGLSVNDG